MLHDEALCKCTHITLFKSHIIGQTIRRSTAEYNNNATERVSLNQGGVLSFAPLFFTRLCYNRRTSTVFFWHDRCGSVPLWFCPSAKTIAPTHTVRFTSAKDLNVPRRSLYHPRHIWSRSIIVKDAKNSEIVFSVVSPLHALI